MATTIHDIAKKAGVSIATVSLVFNRKPGVGHKTREKVLKIARELNYRRAYPENDSMPVGRTVRFLKISCHGRTVNRDHDSFIADYIDGIDQQARLAGYTIEVNMFANTRAQEIVQFLSTVSAAGAIILGTEMSLDDARAFEKSSLPVVIIDTFYDFLPLNFVDMNNDLAAFTAISHLVDRGHREIGFIRGNVEVANFRMRERGFLDAMKHFRLPVSKKSVIPVDSTFDGAFQDMKRYLSLSPALPSALFISNDIIAYGCMKAMKAHGIRVPEDVSIIGFDDLPMSSVMEVPLTTISVSKRDMGKRAFDLLSARIIEGRDRPSEKILIDGKLIVRESVRDI